MGDNRREEEKEVENAVVARLISQGGKKSTAVTPSEKVLGVEGKNGTRLELLVDSKCFGGRQKIYRHFSSEVNCFMKFSIYIPETEDSEEKFHALFFLSGVMCNEQNFLFKTGFQRFANENKLIVIGPDTSPRGVEVQGDRETPFVGRSAGWYLDATEEPWKNNYRMYSYVSKELPEIIKKNFPTTGKFGLCGHSMGGNGTVVIGLRNPNLFQSISLLAPSCNPTSWGHEIIYKKYLGDNKDLWQTYDAFHVMKEYDGPFRDILLDQGAEDEYLNYLLPERLKESSEVNPNGKKCLSVNLQMHEGYDHSYYFVASFIEKHFQHHARILDQ